MTKKGVEIMRQLYVFLGTMVLILGQGLSGDTAVAETFPNLIPLPDGFRPEGVVVGKGPAIYAGSLATGAVYRADLRSGQGEIVAIITDPALDVPTTITEFGNSLYAVNARFGTPPEPDTFYDVVRVAKEK
jgi:hypothetical protein